MPKLPTNTPGFDPLYTLILVSLAVFLLGMITTNETARSVIMHPFG